MHAGAGHECQRAAVGLFQGHLQRGPSGLEMAFRPAGLAAGATGATDAVVRSFPGLAAAARHPCRGRRRYEGERAARSAARDVAVLVLVAADPDGRAIVLSTSSARGYHPARAPTARADAPHTACGADNAPRRVALRR